MLSAQALLTHVGGAISRKLLSVGVGAMGRLCQNLLLELTRPLFSRFGCAHSLCNQEHCVPHKGSRQMLLVERKNGSAFEVAR